MTGSGGPPQDPVAAWLTRMQEQAALEATPWRRLQRRVRGLRATSSTTLDRLVGVRNVAQDVVQDIAQDVVQSRSGRRAA